MPAGLSAHRRGPSLPALERLRAGVIRATLRPAELRSRDRSPAAIRSGRESDLSGGLYVRRAGRLCVSAASPNREETLMAISQEEHLKELSKGYRFDWKDASHSVFEPKRGCPRRSSRRSRRAEDRAGLDAQAPAEGARALRRPSDAVVGRRPVRASTSTTSSTSSARPRRGGQLGGPARRHQGHLGQARHPRGGEEVPRRRERPVRVRGRLPQDQEGARRHRRASSPTWTRRCATTPIWSRSTSARSSRRTTTSSRR